MKIKHHYYSFLNTRAYYIHVYRIIHAHFMYRRGYSSIHTYTTSNSVHPPSARENRALKQLVCT